MTTSRARPRLVRALVAGFFAIGVATAGFIVAPAASASASSLTRDLRADLTSYLSTYAAVEHVSAASLSVSLPGRAAIEASAGTMVFGGSRPVVPDSLWQIGSNTKAFTAVLVLKLEAEHRLSIDDTVGRWLPQYPQWSDVTIRRLLNMTSGIPSYEDQAAFLTDYAANPYTRFTEERLVGYAAAAPPTTGFSYSNTGYILAQMIIEKVTHDSYEHQLHSRLIAPLGLRDLYYLPHLDPPSVTAREPAAYFFIQGLPPVAGLVGTDVSRQTLSWTQAAGGIVGTTTAMTQWERALYGDRLLPAKQRAELFSLVSQQSGEPIDETSPDDLAGFGLGVSQEFSSKGAIWTYEGGTMGVRTWHGYFPSSGLIIAIGLNSQSLPDNIKTLPGAVYATLAAHHLV